MTGLDTTRYGYVRRHTSQGEAWHIVQEPPSADSTANAPTLCLIYPLYRTWGVIGGDIGGGSVCSRCVRAYKRHAHLTHARPRPPQKVSTP